MITKTYINDDMDALTSFIAASGLFDAVTNENSTIICKDADGNTLLSIAVPTAANGNVVVTAFASASVSKAVTWSYYKSGSIGVHFTYAYACTNGVIIALQNAMGNDYYAAVLISKNNQGIPVIVLCDAIAPTANAYRTFWAVSWGDVAPLSTFNFTVNSRSQTTVVPFMSNNDISASSYTPNAGYIPVGQYYNMGYGTLVIDGTDYLANGYWAIRD